MNADRLLRALSMIGEEPARVQQMRQVVVALAIADKLGAGPDDLSIEGLLQEVEKAKADLYRQRSIRKPKNLKPVERGDLPEAFPGARRFAPLGALARVEKGLTGIKQARPGPFPLVVTGAGRANCDHFDFEGAAAIIPLVSSTGHGNASLNRLHYQEGKFALGTILAAVFPYDPALISARFLFEYLSTFKEELLVARMTGTANVTLSVGRIEEVPVPLVSPSTQTKVAELMTLLDQLEAGRAAREAVRDQLAAASLARLNAPDPATFPGDARFVLGALPAITTRPDQIGALRQTILNLAVRGKLAPQDGDDEPASELLDRLHRERRHKRTFAHISEDELDAPLFDLPSGWLWTTPDQISADEDNAITDGPFGSQLKTDHYIEAPGFRVIRLQNIGDGSFRAEHRSFIDQFRYERLTKHHVKAGDLVVAGLVDPRVRCCEVPADIGPAVVKADCYRFAVHPRLSSRYALYCLNSPTTQSFAAVHHHGMTLTRIGLGNFRRIPIPLPPLAEQHRIVEKVDGLMNLCDRLEASLTVSNAIRSRLLDALLAEALVPTLLEKAA